MIVKKIELFSYVKVTLIPLSIAMEGFDVRVFQIKKSVFQSIKQFNFGKTVCYSLYAGSLMVHACYLYSGTFINYLFGYRGYSVIGGCFTLNEYRGRGLYPNMLRRIAQENKKKIVIYVATSNLSSIRGIEKAGFVCEKKLILYKFMGIPVYTKYVNIR